MMDLLGMADAKLTRRPERGHGVYDVQVDGRKVGDVWGPNDVDGMHGYVATDTGTMRPPYRSAHTRAEAQQHDNDRRQREFATREAAVAWLVQGCPLPAGRCPVRRNSHPFVQCRKEDAHEHGHQWWEA